MSPQERARAEQARINLIRFRKELGLKATHVARRAEIPLDGYRSYEKEPGASGHRLLTNAATLRALGEALGHAVDDFYEKDPPPSDPARVVAVRFKIVDDDVGPRALAEAMKAQERIAEIHREELRERKAALRKSSR